MKLFLQKNAKFSSAGGSAPRPPWLRRLGALPPNPQPPAAGGFAPRLPLASGGWGRSPQTPSNSPPHCEFLATRLIIGSHLCAAVGGQQLCKQSRKLQTRIMFENHYFFVHYCLLSCRYAMLQKSILNEPKLGGTSSRLGGRRPLPHRSDGTGYQYKK